MQCCCTKLALSDDNRYISLCNGMYIRRLMSSLKKYYKLVISVEQSEIMKRRSKPRILKEFSLMFNDLHTFKHYVKMRKIQKIEKNKPKLKSS